MSFRAIPIHIPLPPVGGTAWVRLPTADAGGACQVVDVRVFNAAATASTASFTVDVIKASNVGTPAVNGTIAATIGGTASHWAVGVPQGTSPSASAGRVEAGEYVGVRCNQQTIGTVTAPASCMLLVQSGVTGA